uniref:mediator of RNA polymerase II transcription subunit 23-like n=1 Tax=Styela clava TaxID=7725 RepID=UPI00193964F3|nr:mediator of RNA polymerase II transcription subunit 23-like [Styela clava]
MSIDSRLEKVFDDALKTDTIVNVFAGFVRLTPEDHDKRLRACLSQFQEMTREIAPEDCVSGLLNFFHKQTVLRHINFVADMIKICLKDSILPTKTVLQRLIPHEMLKHNRRVHWCKTFEILKEYIHLIEYKGCRDILHLVLLKLKNVPTTSWSEMTEQMNAIIDVIEYLLDPEACLLPGYLAVNEIRQYSGEDQPPGHWSLSGKVAEFVDRFRATATMVSTTGRSHLLPVVFHFSVPLTTTWKLDHETLRFTTKGQLPYDKSLYQRQTKLLRYILEQPYSRDMVCHVLNLQKQQKQRCEALETELVDLVVSTMERTSEIENLDEKDDAYRIIHLQWQHLSSQVIYFVLLQFAVFPRMVENFYQKLSSRNVKNGRDHLMWVLLQFISGSIQKNPLSDFLPIIKLMNLLYSERQPLPEPDITKPFSTHKFAAICILMHLNRKAQSDNQQQENASSNSSSGSISTTSKTAQFQHCAIPVSLQKHHEYLQRCLESKNNSLQDYAIALICNACSTTTELFNGPINSLVDSIYGDSTTTPLPGENCVAFAKTTPLSMSLLDSLTVHTKMSLIHHIVVKVMNLAQNNSNVALSPAVVETYSRLLVYMETESLGVKGLISQVFPKVLQNNSLGILNTLLEMFSYRLHHIQPQYRIQLLTNLHRVAAEPNTDHNQLQICVESTALRMITALSNADVKPQLSRFTSEPKQIISKESEELNRALVLTLARSIHITGAETISGSWCNDILKAILEETPHRWASHTLKCFPRSLQIFYQHNQIECTNKETLKNNVEDEYRKWGQVISKSAQPGNSNSNSNAAVSESDALAYFTMDGSPPFFLCLLWKILTLDRKPSLVCHNILTVIGRRKLSTHVRTFSDFLVHEFSLDGGSHVKRYIPIVRDMILKYNLVFLDQLILCLALRCNEGNEAQVAFFIIQYLLMKPDDFRARVHSFVQDTKSAEHWTLDDWHVKHMNYHRKFPEKFYFEGLKSSATEGEEEEKSSDSSQQYLPVYFGNLTLRFLPVFDLVVHRFLELMPVTNSLETLLAHLGPLYKFHEQPITYLFNTLHYYEARLRDRHSLKKTLVSTIIGSMNDTKPQNWALSEQYLNYAAQQDNWKPENNYFCMLVRRLVDTIDGKHPAPFPACDWRFNEFPNAAAHALHVTCVELMALPMQPESVGLALMEVVLKMQSVIERKYVMMWTNAVALLLTTLPEIYWKPLHTELVNVIQSPALNSSAVGMTEYPYYLLKFSDQHLSFSDHSCTRLLALTHVVWHHMGIGQLSLVPQFLKEQVKPNVMTELQLLYVFHLIGPFLPRFQHERTRCMIDVAVVLYDMLLQVSENCDDIRFMDEIADFLYHLKYMHIGIAINNQVEGIIDRLKPGMRKRLRFIIHTASAKEQFRSPSAPSSASHGDGT